MSPEREQLIDLAGETGFGADALEKILRLGQVLDDVFHHPLLSTSLHLKGGTALNLCYGPPSRLSVDLDFNYIGERDRSRMLQARPHVEVAAMRLARARGYKVQLSRDEHAGRKLYLGYLSTAGTMERVQLDLNFLHREGLGRPQRLTLWQPGSGPRPEVTVVGVEDLCIGKLCALLDRTLPRDLYDVIRLHRVAADVWGTPRFHSLFVAIAGTLDHPLHSYGRQRFDRVTDDTIEKHLWPMLQRNDRPAAAELVEQAWRVVEPLLALSEAEREYTNRIQKGDFRPDLLFSDDSEIAARLSRLPALLWKAENARRAGGRKR